jgi:hypothetical protein
MEFIKKVFAFLAIGLNTVFAYSAQPKIIEPREFVIIADKTKSCQKTLENTIKTILDASSIKISKGAFTKEPHLYITNQKITSLAENPMQGYEGGNKIFLLHLKNGVCFISLVDSKNRPLSSHKIEGCDCIRADTK